MPSYPRKGRRVAPFYSYPVADFPYKKVRMGLRNIKFPKV